MIIKSVHVQNFRCILDETLECDQLTVIVGANGVGKSTFLRALDMFYAPSPRVTVEDFYNRDTSSEIVISVTFEKMSEQARELFASYIEIDPDSNGSILTVERVFAWNEGRFVSTYHGSTLQNPDFAEIRRLPNATEKKKQYEQLRRDSRYSDLPTWKNQAESLACLTEWENRNQEYCSRSRDDGQFFGFSEVARGYLGMYSRFIFIEAVRDAQADVTEGRGSVITNLMDLVVRSVLLNREDFKQFREEIQNKYEELIKSRDTVDELANLSRHLTEMLRNFVEGASVNLEWMPQNELDIPIPKADVQLEEDGYKSTVPRVGHGLQRAFIITLLQSLASVQAYDSEQDSEGKIELPSLVIAIEEPELYQHPNRQRHFAKTLRRLAENDIPGVIHDVQIMYATHSPLFVGIDRFDQIRVARKIESSSGSPKTTHLSRITLDHVARILQQCEGNAGVSYSGETLAPRLHTLMTPWMNEGFFADVVVLVEGEDDRAIILGAAQNMGHDLENMGYSVIPCGGKNNIDRPFVIFRELGIPCYVIWDSDRSHGEPARNHYLLRLMGYNEPFEDRLSHITERSASFEENLETTLQNEIGESVFNRHLETYQQRYGFSKRKDALKSPVVIAEVFHSVSQEGYSSPTVAQILTQILALKSNSPRITASERL